MGTVHYLADARKKYLRPEHETKMLTDTAKIVGEYFAKYLEFSQELADHTAKLNAHKECMKGWRGWLKSFYKRPTTNQLQHAVDYTRLRMKFWYGEYKQAKAAFDCEKEKLDRRLEWMDMFRKPEYLPVDPPK